MANHLVLITVTKILTSHQIMYQFVAMTSLDHYSQSLSSLQDLTHHLRQQLNKTAVLLVNMKSKIKV